LSTATFDAAPDSDLGFESGFAAGFEYSLVSDAHDADDAEDVDASPDSSGAADATGIAPPVATTTPRPSVKTSAPTRETAFATAT
jgi:hypothetical protein